MNRRQFCRNLAMLGGMVALAPLVEGCAEPAAAPAAAAPTAIPTATRPAPTATTPPTATPKSSADPQSAADPQPTATTQPTSEPTATQTATAAAGMAAVALVAASDRAAGVRQAIELLGANPVSGRHVLLKPNFNSADAAPGSTHDDVLKALLAGLSDMGARTITVADRSGMGDTRQVMQRKGVFDLIKPYGARAVVLDELPDDDWEIVNGDGFHWSRGFPVPKLLLDAECVVQTCNLKTHRYGGHFTLSLKNSVGLVAKYHSGYNYMNELHGSDHQRRMIAEINTAYRPALVLLDGVEAFVKGGPDRGALVSPGVVLAGTDRIALDAAGVAILRMFGTTPEVSRGRVFEQEQIARSVELGLGADSPEKIEFVTADADGMAYATRIREVLLA